MSKNEFDELAQRAFQRIPARFRRRMQNVVIIVENEPSHRQLQAARVPPGDTLFGLYEGRPLTVRGWSDGFTMPDQITIFQGPHERHARGPTHLEALVHATIWHEIAHHFGMDEHQVRRAERNRTSGLTLEGDLEG